MKEKLASKWLTSVFGLISFRKKWTWTQKSLNLIYYMVFWALDKNRVIGKKRAIEELFKVLFTNKMGPLKKPCYRRTLCIILGHSTPKWILIKSLQSKWHFKSQSRPPNGSKSLEIKIFHCRIFLKSIFFCPCQDSNSWPLDL